MIQCRNGVIGSKTQFFRQSQDILFESTECLIAYLREKGLHFSEPLLNIHGGFNAQTYHRCYSSSGGKEPYSNFAEAARDGFRAFFGESFGSIEVSLQTTKVG